MGSLALRLAEAFVRAAPSHWRCEPEAHLLPPELRLRAGFDVRSDLLLYGPQDERIVLEFEVSRADPIANPAKYLLAQALGGLRPTDGFAGMLSSHLASGKRNQTIAFTRLLRAKGYSAFHLSLLPHLAPARVKALNALAPAALERVPLDGRAELNRVLAVMTPAGERDHRIHYAGDAADVIENVWVWNEQVRSEGRDLWGRRRVQYFVAEPRSGQFAPSKFCAFLPARRPGGPAPPTSMTLQVYAQLGEEDPRFDGAVARRHLRSRLAFGESPLRGDGTLAEAFATWHGKFSDHLQLREPVRLLLPPRWFSP